MQNNHQSPNRMRLDYNDGSDLWLSNQSTLRTLIGVLGMLLPLMLYGVLFLDTDWYSPLHSISHYYYTRAAGVFVIIVSLLAIFLIVYKGKKPVDFWLSTVAGIFALCVVLFPTSNISESALPDTDNPFSVTLLKANKFRVMFHYASAAIFLLCLSAMSIWVFTMSDKNIQQRGQQKRRRNRVYRTCGAIMILAVCVVFFGGLLGLIPEDVYEGNNLTFWMETVAVECFGFAWLVKGGVLLRDKPGAVADDPEFAQVSDEPADLLPQVEPIRRN